MRRLLLVGALVLLCSAARADFAISLISESDVSQDMKLYLDNAVHDAAFTGVVGDQTSGPLINIVTNVFPATVGNGWSTISAVSGGMTSITFTPVDQNTFTSFYTRGSLFAAGDVTITVTDNYSQSFSFTEQKSQDWPRIGVAAIPGTGEFISSVVVSSADASNIKELKQIAFGTTTDVVINPTAIAPEPSSLALAGVGLVGLGLYRFRRRNK